MADPSILVKNRKQMAEQMMDDYGYHFCEKCSRSGGFMFLEWHHIIFRSEAPDHDMLHSKKNLILVCDVCHRGFHNVKTSRDYLIKERGLLELFKGLRIRNDL